MTKKKSKPPEFELPHANPAKSNPRLRNNFSSAIEVIKNLHTEALYYI